MDLIAKKQVWEFLLNSYYQKGGFKDGGYLVQFPREGDKKFKSRKDCAFYVNYTKEVIERFSSYLFKKPIVRNSNNDFLKMIFDDADFGGNSVDIFIQKLFKKSFLLGTGLVLIDMPKIISKDLKAQKQNREAPYFVDISLLDVYDFSFKNGKFEWIIFKFEIEEKTPFLNSKKRFEYHYWDALKFERRDENKNKIEEFTHNLGICPVIVLNLADGLFENSICCEISEISKRIYNARSELDEILRGQTFSVLAYHTPPDAVIPTEDIEISVNNVLLYQGNKPEFISPSEANAKIYMELIQSLESKISEIGLNPINFSSRSNDSGAALKFKFESLNAMLLKISNNLEDFERRIFDCVNRWLKIKDWDFSVSYPCDFSISDLQNDIQTALAMEEFGMPISWKKSKQKELARLDLAGLDSDEMNEIYDEIEQNQ